MGRTALKRFRKQHGFQRFQTQAARERTFQTSSEKPNRQGRLTAYGQHEQGTEWSKRAHLVVGAALPLAGQT